MINETVVFPNPSSSGRFQFLNKGAQNLATSVQSIEIYNILGEKIYHLIKAGLINGSIDLSSQPDAIYNIVLSSIDKTYHQKAVKLKKRIAVFRTYCSIDPLSKPVRVFILPN